MNIANTTTGSTPAKSDADSIREIKKLHGSIIHAAKMSLDSATADSARMP
jgi:hypothetical protein